MGVEAARVGQDPQAARSETLGLRSHGGLRSIEGDPVRGDAEDGHAGRSVALGSLEQAGGALAELRGVQLRGRRGGPVDEIRDAEPGLEQLLAVPGRQQPVGEARGVEGGPELVAWTGEMAAGGARVAAGVDAAEQDLEPGRDDVGDGPAVGRLELGARRAPGMRRGRGLHATTERSRLVHRQGNMPSSTDTPMTMTMTRASKGKTRARTRPGWIGTGRQVGRRRERNRVPPAIHESATR